MGFFLIKKRASSSVMEVDCFSVQTGSENAPHVSLTIWSNRDNTSVEMVIG